MWLPFVSRSEYHRIIDEKNDLEFKLEAAYREHDRTIKRLEQFELKARLLREKACELSPIPATFTTATTSGI